MAEGPGSSHRLWLNGEEPKSDSSAIEGSQIKSALDRILKSPEFRSSKRCCEFLQYVVEQSLSGHAESLKERTIGIEVFGRPTEYEPSEDATVRVKAGEVRKRLGLYYAGPGAADEVRIDLPHGTYAPEFSRRLPGEVHNPKPAPTGRRTPAALLLVSALAGTLLWLALHPGRRTLDQFWAPVLKRSTPVLLCASYVPAYTPNSDAGKDSAAPAQFVLLADQFVGGGDLLAISRMSAMLTRMNHPFRVKIGSDVSLTDLRSSPAVLVGYSYTRWKEISKELRYFIDVERRPLMVSDNGAATAWALPDIKTDRQTNEDYAIITRVFHPETREMLVELAGITQYGTDAAAELVTDQDLLTEALKGTTADWQKKNLQLVIHVKVMFGAAASPRVMATHIW